MISFLNRKLRGFLFIILVLVAAAFIFIDIPTSGTLDSRHVGKIRGESISRSDFQKYYRETELSFTLTTGQMISQFPGMQELILKETWNRLITLKAAEEAGIEISADEVTTYVTQHPIFQQDGRFDPNRFQQFAAAFFDPPGVNIAEGMNLERFESAVRHQLMIEQFNFMIQSSAVATTDEVEGLIDRLHGTSTIQVASLSRDDIAREIKIDDQELEAFYQQNLQQYMTPEKRQVQYVYFSLPAGAPKTGEKRESMLHELGKKAFHFSDPFYRAQQDGTPLPDFSDTATQAELNLMQSEFFSITGKIAGVPGEEKLVEVTFSLDDQSPVSDAIPVDNGFVVARLSEVQPSEPIPFAQADTEIRKDYRERETERRLSVDGRQMAVKLRQLLTEGIAWSDAVKQAGFKSGNTLKLIPSQELRSQDNLKQLAARSASAMDLAETSPFELLDNIGYVFHLSQRSAPADTVVAEKRISTQQQLVAQQGAMLVREWVRAQYNAPGTDLPFAETASSL